MKEFVGLHVTQLQSTEIIAPVARSILACPCKVAVDGWVYLRHALVAIPFNDRISQAYIPGVP